MNIYEIIEIVIGIITTITAFISIIISVNVLKQNNKMIEGNTRPYIVVYGYVVNFGSPRYTIAVKNFGNTAATIKEFSANIDLDQISYDKGENRAPFNNITGITMPPNFSIIRDANWKGTPNNIKFKVKYSSTTKNYEEEFILNYDIERNSPNSRDNFKDDTIKNISYALQEYVKRNV